MSQKSYDDSSTLYLIPTPIGNMDDITIRSIKMLEKVDVIFSEDTRNTLKLLTHLNIKKKLIASHEHNELLNKEKLIDFLKNGQNVGLVTDRGTPVISDPGYELVKHAIANKYNVVSLPGATALIPALVVSGIKPMPFKFVGFLDSKENIRKKQLQALIDEEATMIFYEAPHRILKTLNNIKNIMGNRQISISREISKRFEEVYRGSVEEVINELGEPLGEMVVILSGNSEEINNSLSVDDNINMYIKQGYSIMDAIKKTAKDKHVSKSVIYEKYHKKV